jgi:hypothetical protein
MIAISLPILGPLIYQTLPDMDAPPPAPWGGDGNAPDQNQEPQPEEQPVPVQEPWTEQAQPVRDPSVPAQRWRLH